MLKLITATIACALLASSFAGADTVIGINGADQGRLFDGIGGLSAGANSRLLYDYPEPQRSQILDFLFKPNFGASLQILKVEIGGGGNSTWGAEPAYANTRNEFDHPDPDCFDTGYEWWLMEEAKKRNPDIILQSLQWCAPGWIGGGQFYSQDNIDYVLNFIKAARDYHGVTIDVQGIRNECAWDIAWIKQLRAALDSNGLGDVKLVAADGGWDMASDVAADPNLRDAVYSIGVHYPSYNSTDTARNLGKPIWASEESQSGDPWARADGYARLYNRDYIIGRMTETIICSLITSNYIYLAPWGVVPWADPGLMRACTPWSGHYDVPPTIWAVAHTTQFTRPGWRYVDSACGLLGSTGSYVTLRSPDATGDYSVIVETMQDVGYQSILPRKDTDPLPVIAPRQVTFNVSNLSTATVHVWRTNMTSRFERLPDIVPQNGSFAITIDGNSIYTLTTTTGQHKGSYAIPPDSAFPMPYQDGFESYSIAQTPKYLSDQEGTFLTANRADGGGKCLRQVVPQRPIEWGWIQFPWSIIGDIDWADYQVSADVCVENTGSAGILGRIDNPLGSSLPGGYGLSIDNTGAWQVTDTASILDHGTIAISSGSWHNLMLRFGGTVGTAVIDGEVVSNFAANAHTKGAAGLMGSFAHTDYDNLAIEPYAVGPSAAVSGILRDATTGQPVSCAIVVGGISSTTTDPSGAFSVLAPIGPATISARSDAYEDSKIPVTVPTQGLSGLNLTIRRKASDLTWQASGATAAGGANPAAAIDGNACTSWTMANNYRSGWLTVEWPMPQVIDTLTIRQGSAYIVNIDVWRDGAWVKVAKIGDDASLVSLPIRAEWDPISTTKIRLRNLISATDIETYNLRGVPPTPNLVGTVRRAGNGSVLKNVTVAASGVTTVTDELGRYRLAVPAGGSVQVTASRLMYDSSTRNVRIPTTGRATADFDLTTRNVAPLATASANNIYSDEYAPWMGNNDDFDDRYSAAGTYSTNWYELDWPSPVTVDRVVAYQIYPWESNLGVDWWDGANWQRAAYVTGVPLTVEASFAPVTTTKIKLWEVSSYSEVEVDALEPLEHLIGGLRELPDGTPVLAHGSVTAVFDDAAYVESDDRSSAVRAVPASLFRIGGQNLCQSATARASTTSAGHNAANAIDNNPNTFWVAANSGYQWLELVWPTPQTFDTIRLSNCGWNSPVVVEIFTASGWILAAGHSGASDMTIALPSAVTTTRLLLGDLLSVSEVQVFAVSAAASMVGKQVSVYGTMATSGSERVLNAAQVSQTGDHIIAPLGFDNRDLSAEQQGASSVGLLVCVWGRVRKVGDRFMYIDDGSEIPSADLRGVKVILGDAKPAASEGDLVRVTGIARAVLANGIIERTVTIRSESDVRNLAYQ